MADWLGTVSWFLIFVCYIANISLRLALALALSRPDPSSSTSFNPPLLITDLPQLLQLQAQNIMLNNLSPLSIMSAAFPWGSPISSTVPVQYTRPDVILAADCVYFEPAFPLLLETLKELMNANGSSEEVKDSVCWFSMKKRRKADMRFVASLKKAFTVREVEVKREEGEEGVYLYVLDYVSSFFGSLTSTQFRGSEEKNWMMGAINLVPIHLARTLCVEDSDCTRMPRDA